MLCLLYIWCQMEMGCFALLLIECQPSTADATNICIDCFLFNKLATELWGMLDSPRDEYRAAWKLNGLSKVIFQRLLVPFHSHTPLHHNEVTPRHNAKKETLFYLRKNISIVLFLQHFPQSQAQLLIIHSAKQVSGFEREMTRKGMKGMEPLTVTCSQSNLHLFSVLGTDGKIQ